MTRARWGPGPRPAQARPKPVPPSALPPEREHASALVLLSMLQREGRLSTSSRRTWPASRTRTWGPPRASSMRAAARWCSSTCAQARPAGVRGSRVTVPAGFDAQRIRLTGNVAGQPPYSGSLKHHGWVTTEVKFPTVSPAMDPRVLAPAEVELA